MARSSGVIVDTTIYAGGDARDDFPVVLNTECQGAFQFFSSIAARDAWSNSYPSRRFGTVACVFDANLLPAQVAADFYRWNGALEDGSDGAWVLLPIAHSAAATLLKWASIAAGTSGSTSLIYFDQGLLAEKEINTDAIHVQIDKKLFADEFAPDFLAFGDTSIPIHGEGLSTLKRNAVWFGPSMLSKSPYIVPDQPSKTLHIQPSDGIGSSDYLIVILINFEGTVLSPGSIILELRKADAIDAASDYVIDINGQALAVEHQYSDGQELGQIMLAAIVNIPTPTYLSAHVISTMSNPLFTSPSDDALSGILIQAVNANARGLYAFEHMTDSKVRWRIHHMTNPLSSLAPILASDIPEGVYGTTGPKFIENGYELIPLQSSVDVIVKNSQLTISTPPGSSSSLTYFYLDRSFSGSQLNLLQGKTLTATVTVTPGGDAGMLKFLSWTGQGAPSSAPAIFTGYENLSPVLGEGWTELNSTFLSAGFSGDRTVNLTVVVPKNVQRIAFVFLMMEPTAPATYVFKAFDITLQGAPLTSASISYARPAHELQLALHPNRIRFFQTSEDFVSLRYTINAKESACPIGIAEKHGSSVVLDPSVNKIPGSAAEGGEGALKFLQATKATIALRVYVYPGEKLAKGNTAPVTFTWYRVDAKDDFKDIPNASLTLKVSGGGPVVAGRLSIQQNFDAGDRLALRMKTSADDAAFMVSYSKHQPMIDVEVISEELQASG